MAAKFKKGDTVTVLAGKDKGKRGEILRVLRVESRLLVRGVNMVKRHTRPSQTTQGGIVEQEASIHVSNVSHIDPKSDEATRVGFKLMEDGSKVRFAKRSGEVIDR
ncbi:50S ribosomal protein L24 [Alphaproteobacteria bacterium]|jgi:large subunit ribosomal protein L24|nr:50S ribosomal protein L24 [Alphaproteobacteria bacterium]|tara:strand:+ start:124 stop:441 length:318 start_codon:yes stop_codon:yes gene_type:complete